MRAQVRARVGRAVASLRAVEEGELRGRVRLRAWSGRAPRGAAVVGRVAELAGERVVLVAHAVCVCVVGRAQGRCWMGVGLHMGVSHNFYSRCWAANRPRPRGGRRGRHGSETLGEVVELLVVLW